MLLPTLVLARYSPGLLAGQEEGESVRIVGVASRVEAARVVIRTAEGATLTPLEDFTKTLSVGSKVTAWYYVQGRSGFSSAWGRLRTRLRLLRF